MINHCNKEGHTALHAAAINGNHVCVRILLEFSITDVLLNTPTGDNALSLAIKLSKKSSNIENHLLTIDALVGLQNTQLNNSPNGSGFTPLSYACLNEQEKVIQKLLENGADINHPMQDGNHILHILSECHSVSTDIINLIVSHCQNINVTNNAGLSPIHKAVELENYVLLKILLEHPNLELGHQNILGMVAYGDFCDHMLSMLIDKCPQWMLECPSESPLILAVVSNNLHAVQMFFERDVRLNLLIKSNCNILHSINLVTISEEIIEFIFNALKNLPTDERCHIINNRDIKGQTPLMYAAFSNNLKVMDKLLQFEETDLLLQNNNGCTALILAIFKDCSLKNISKLITFDKSKTLVNIPANDGRIPLQLALSYERLDIIKLLIEDGRAKMTWQDLFGNTLIPLTVIANHQLLSMEIFQYFVNDHRIIITEREKSMKLLYERPLLFQWLFERFQDDENKCDYDDYDSHEIFSLLKNTNEIKLKKDVELYIERTTNPDDLHQIKDRDELTFIQRCNSAGFYKVSKHFQETYNLSLTDLWSYEECKDNDVLEYIFSQPNIEDLINQESLYRRRILHDACYEENSELMKLNSENIDILHRDFSGRTVLHYLLRKFKVRFCTNLK